MTDSPTPDAALGAPRVVRQRRSTKSVVAAVAAVAASATLATFGGLWLQMASGNDPVLAAKSATKPKKVIKQIVVIKKVPATDYGSASGSSYGSYGYSGSSSYGSSGSSVAPVAVAPAPAPAPVVTQTS